MTPNTSTSRRDVVTEDTEPYPVVIDDTPFCAPHKEKKCGTKSKKTKTPNKSFAQKIDESVWFHTLYGLLDGLSVSYSTVKFLCDVSSSTQESYHEKLHDAFSHPSNIAIIALESVLITSIAAIGNFGFKNKGKHKAEVFIREFWPYFRDVLKGVKNGYKGIKGIAFLLKEFGAFTDAGFRAFAIPVGLAIGMIGMINRLVRRGLYSQHKALVKKQKALLEKIKAHNNNWKQQLEIKDKLERLAKELSLLQEEHSADKINLLIERAALKKQLQKLTNKPLDDTSIGVKEVEKEFASVSKEIEQFTSKNHRRFFTSSVIGAIADGPYLYAVVLTLATISGPLLTSMCMVLVTMLVATILTRWQEEVTREKNTAISLLETKKELLLAKSNQLYEAYCKAKDLDCNSVKNEILGKLKASWDDLHNVSQELTKLETPSIKAAIIEGIKDGLSLFGATTSVYFSVAIVLLLSSGAMFPPAAVAAAVFVGLAAMIGFASYRAYKAHQEKKHIKNIAEKRRQEIPANDHWLSIVDCNTDGLTKGEFYFQQTFEVSRAASAALYKANNLDKEMNSNHSDKALSLHEKGGLPQLIFLSIVGGIYTLCLALRAFGSGFSKRKDTSSSTTHDEKKDIELDDLPRKFEDDPALKSESFSYTKGRRYTMFSQPNNKTPETRRRANTITAQRELFTDLTNEPKLNLAG